MIFDNLKNVCDWMVDAICEDGNRWEIDYLYPNIDSSKDHCRSIGKTNEGFTHILRFYK